MLLANKSRVIIRLLFCLVKKACLAICIDFAAHFVQKFIIILETLSTFVKNISPHGAHILHTFHAFLSKFLRFQQFFFYIISIFSHFFIYNSYTFLAQFRQLSALILRFSPPLALILHIFNSFLAHF